MRVRSQKQVSAVSLDVLDCEGRSSITVIREVSRWLRADWQRGLASLFLDGVQVSS